MSIDLGTPAILSPDEAERAVLLAAPRGYCAGVDRAVVTVEKALDLYGAPVYVRKQIVHNKHVVSDLESRGAIFVEELDEVPDGATVVFSAHGVSPEVHREADEREPQDDRRHLPAGHEGAPRGEAVRRRGLRHPADRPRGSRRGRGHRRRGSRAHPARPEPRGVPNIVVRDPAKVASLSRPRFLSTRPSRPSAAIAERLPLLLDPPRRHLLRHRRRLAVKEIALDADLVIVVGSGDSSDSVRLVEVALEAGTRTAYRVDDATGSTRPGWRVSTRSASPGSSVPEELVEACSRSSRSAATRTPGRARAESR